MCRFPQGAPGLWRAREMVFFHCCLAQFLSTGSGTLSGFPALTSYLLSLKVGNLVSSVAGDRCVCSIWSSQKKILSVLANVISLWVKTVLLLWSMIAFSSLITAFSAHAVEMFHTFPVDIFCPFVPLFQIWPDSTVAVGVPGLKGLVLWF